MTLSDEEFKDVLEEWLTALRSDKYTQGRGHLRSAVNPDDAVPCMCCLGVLTDIYGRREGHGQPVGWKKEGHLYAFHGPGGDRQTHLLSIAAVVWLGNRLPNPDGEFPGRALQLRLDMAAVAARWPKYKTDVLRAELIAIGDGNVISAPRLNDSLSMTFDQIADAVECATHINDRPNPVYRPLDAQQPQN